MDQIGCGCYFRVSVMGVAKQGLWVCGGIRGAYLTLTRSLCLAMDRATMRHRDAFNVMCFAVFIRVIGRLQ